MPELSTEPSPEFKLQTVDDGASPETSRLVWGIVAMITLVIWGDYVALVLAVFGGEYNL